MGPKVVATETKIMPQKKSSPVGLRILHMYS
eukprot:CAMPEP_0175652600 /NCGR_PEP_ID=MMETSP0097-20121207/10451_1 /TAXON_ID=311494 /ORGANISM="Alexandrium monilatum, Strain CCMP3105" /LENGTH=30 /DNA_ID= /DNA_START= /DNA_END= /DNA_ORIENTATION=